MTQNETVEVLKILTTAYPKYYSNITREQANNMLNLWSTMFADKDVKDVINALKAFILTDDSGFPPTIGQINNQIYKLNNANEMSELEAWSLVAKACRDSAYHSKERFEALPDKLQKLVGSPNQLKYWSSLQEDELETVVQSNFMRSYKHKSGGERISRT